jgi:hypothetical protein
MPTAITGATGPDTIPDNIVTANKIPNASITPAKLTQTAVLGTAVNTTTGTSVDITGIPSWAKKITITLSGISTSGTSNEMLQLGAGSVQASGYLGTAATNTTYAAFTTGFGLGTSITSATVLHGVISLSYMGTNTWMYSFNGAYTNSPATAQGAGSVTLSGALDRVRLTTVAGTDTFDAGSMNILYE